MIFRALLVCLLAAPSQEKDLPPSVDRAGGTFDLQGPCREYVDAVTAQWLLKMPDTNPAILEMFADRDKKPYKSLLPWSGEFAGKYLTGAVQVLRLTGNKELKDYLAKFVAKLVALQDRDGYLGPFPKDSRLTGKAPNADSPWDAWGHYHLMLGLLLWHEDTQDPKALECARKIGDLLCSKFLRNKRVVTTGNAEMNHAILHSLCLLHRKTKSAKYLDLAKQIVDEFQEKGGGDYLRTALADKEFFQGPKPRWESLHPILGLAELHRLTGDEKHRKAFEQIWWSIAKLDRHNTGGFSSGEQAKGNPYDKGAIETCCTIAWVALSVEMLRMTGESVVADEIELATLNAVAGSQSRSGKWCTYNTPMDGVRKRSTTDIAFQARPGSEEINCCSANAPRGFGMISDWALLRDARGLLVNWYGPGTMGSRVGEVAVALRQSTEYPRDGKVTLEVSPEKPVAFALRLRIPHWSEKSKVAVNGEAVAVTRGTYAILDRPWKAGDKVEIEFDFSFHYWVGEKECGGKVSIYRGPILLVHESRSAAPPQFTEHWRPAGNLMVSDTAGSSFEVTFEGTDISWKGRRFDDAGIARVTLDGKEVDRVDQYDPDRGRPFQWELRGLPPGRHVMKVQVLEEKHKASRGRFINVQRISTGEDVVPSFDAGTIEASELVKAEGKSPPIVLLDAGPKELGIRLRDFATAGEGGLEYASWLKVEGVRHGTFSKENPLRSSRTIAK